MVSIDNCQEKTDEELVLLTLADQEYFLCLMKRYEQKLLAYIKRITSVSHEEAEDVLQETFIKTYLNLNNFDQDLKFSSWIYRIAHNEVINNYRKSKARPSLINFEDNDVFIKSIASDLNLVSEMDSKILKENIEKVLNEINPKYREVLILKFLEEKDYREISDILAKPMGTVATLINRAKKQFKEKLHEQNIKL
jgi:RNA polymerase sigma-70 factor (ECF subfamily)